jgi:hypothetical protein
VPVVPAGGVVGGFALTMLIGTTVVVALLDEAAAVGNMGG